jgi:Ethanolamine utilization protein EutJ (predicted chaperonin)
LDRVTRSEQTKISKDQRQYFSSVEHREEETTAEHTLLQILDILAGQSDSDLVDLGCGSVGINVLVLGDVAHPENMIKRVRQR